jgi:hypothetical protein
MKRLKLLIAALLTAPVLLLSAAPVMAVDPFCVNSGSACACQGAAAQSPVCKDRSKGNKNPIAGSTDSILAKAVNLLALIAGVGAVIMIIIGAFNLATSGGNSESIQKAKSRITGALIGLVIISLAWLIVSFAIDKLLK